MLESWNDSGPFLLDACLKVLIALACGSALGLERERREKPAGLRTITLITIGSTLYMIVSAAIARLPDGPTGGVEVDPGRIAGQVVTGIGFLGAGTIIRARGSIHGLTTASVIWVSAAIGLAIGAGFPLVAVAATGIVVLCIQLMGPLAARISRPGRPRTLDLVAPNDALVLRRIESALEEHDMRPEDLEIRPLDDREAAVFIRYSFSSAEAEARFLFALSRIKGVRGKERF